MNGPQYKNVRLELQWQFLEVTYINCVKLLQPLYCCKYEEYHKNRKCSTGLKEKKMFLLFFTLCINVNGIFLTICLLKCILVNKSCFKTKSCDRAAPRPYYIDRYSMGFYFPNVVLSQSHLQVAILILIKTTPFQTGPQSVVAKAAHSNQSESSCHFSSTSWEVKEVM